MKRIWVYSFVAVIVLVHFFLLCSLRKDKSGAEEAQEGQRAVEQQETIAQEGNPAGQGAGQVDQTAKGKAGALGASAPGRNPVSYGKRKIGPYHKGFFQVSEKALPADLAKKVSAVRSGLVIDLDTNTILWQKDPAGVYPIASLTKLLTAIMLMEHLESHPDQTLETRFTVTKEDRKYFDTHKYMKNVFLDTGESFTLDEYLKCMMIKSANDCAYMIARYLAGSSDQFAVKMNDRAKELGLSDMHFNNANGLPIVDQSGRRENMGSALDVAYLAVRVMQYPAVMKWTGTRHDEIRSGQEKPHYVDTTNKLLKNKVPGVTGLKTGSTDGAGQCIVVTCERDGKQRMVVVMGVKGGDTRDEIAKQLLEWSYKQ